MSEQVIDCPAETTSEFSRDILHQYVSPEDREMYETLIRFEQTLGAPTDETDTTTLLDSKERIRAIEERLSQFTTDNLAKLSALSQVYDRNPLLQELAESVAKQKIESLSLPTLRITSTTSAESKIDTERTRLQKYVIKKASHHGIVIPERQFSPARLRERDSSKNVVVPIKYNVSDSKPNVDTTAPAEVAETKIPKELPVISREAKPLRDDREKRVRKLGNYIKKISTPALALYVKFENATSYERIKGADKRTKALGFIGLVAAVGAAGLAGVELGHTHHHINEVAKTIMQNKTPNHSTEVLPNLNAFTKSQDNNSSMVSSFINTHKTVVAKAVHKAPDVIVSLKPNSDPYLVAEKVEHLPVGGNLTPSQEHRVWEYVVRMLRASHIPLPKAHDLLPGTKLTLVKPN